MTKVGRLNKIHKLLKIQEQNVLVEFKELQRTSHDIKSQINDLLDHGSASNDKLMLTPITINQLTLVRTFNEKVEQVVEQLNVQLEKNDKNFLIVSDRIKQIRSNLTSIERMITKYQSIENYEQENLVQRQIEENIGYHRPVAD